MNKTPLSELWVCGDCYWYGTAEERDEDGCCPQCTDDDLMRLITIVEVMYVFNGTDDEVYRMKEKVEESDRLKAENKALLQINSPAFRADLKAKDEEIAKLKKFIEENKILDLAEDLNYRMAILDGSWPQSEEILTKALENAKAMKGKLCDT